MIAAEGGSLLAVDIGGTKLAAALVTPDGDVVRRATVATALVDADQSEALWLRLVALVEQVCGDVAVAGVGVGCGGPMRWPSGHVSPLNIPAWRDFPLRDKLSERLPGVPVRVHNDAICMAIGEHRRGAGAGSQALLGVVVSTGVGGGLVRGGRVIDGRTGNAGHVGHVVVEPDGPMCACGGRGCLEAIARGPAVVAWAGHRGWRPRSGEAEDGKALARSARDGDPIAVAAFDRAGRALGIAIASASHLFELDTVVIGGGLGGAGDLVIGPARTSFNEHARMDFVAGCQIVAATLGTDAGLVGAASLVAPGLRYWTEESS